MSKILDILNKEYFDWMYKLMCGKRRSSYRKLLSYLHDREFVYSIELDGNRAEDGIDLRYRFAYENGYTSLSEVNQLDNGPCSVLEMMIALAIRCEEHIMDDPDIGDRTIQWFWKMIDNLGLKNMNDSHFNERRVCFIIDRFLNREHDEDGKGGLFTVKSCAYDLRTVEIWYQMCWYLDNVLEGEL
jgi:hypothetical protein